MKVAIIGATGMVGEIFLKLLAERNFPVSTLLLAASERSVGKTLFFKTKAHLVQSIDAVLAEAPDIAFFCAGGETSIQYAPKFVLNGTRVIDNSSAWRMNDKVKLIVPEINGSTLTSDDKLIANPNCSTIQLAMVLAPLHKVFKLKRVIVSTYQSVSGTGVKAIAQLENEIAGRQGDMAYSYVIHKNAIPHCDVFEENGYTKEEMKLALETPKILGDKSFGVTATAVRIPVEGGHSESVNIEFHKDFDLAQVRLLLHQSPGIKLQDNTDTNTYPMPFYARHKDEVFVGRIRRDETQANTLNLWIVADNLRKGAATNAIQIAEHCIQNNLF